KQGFNEEKMRCAWLMEVRNDAIDSAKLKRRRDEKLREAFLSIVPLLLTHHALECPNDTRADTDDPSSGSLPLREPFKELSRVVITLTSRNKLFGCALRERKEACRAEVE